MTWFKEVRKDIKEMKINGEEAERREEFRKKDQRIPGFSRKGKKEDRMENGRKKEGNNMEEK